MTSTRRLRQQRRPRWLLSPALNLGPLPTLSHVGPPLRGAVGPSGLDNKGQRLPVIDVEPNKSVHCKPPVQVGHGAFNRPRILLAARRLRFHSFCSMKQNFTPDNEIKNLRPYFIAVRYHQTLEGGQNG